MTAAEVTLTRGVTPMPDDEGPQQRPITGTRMVEERREEQPVKSVAYVEDVAVDRFVREVAWLEAVAAGREQWAVEGPVVDDGEPRIDAGVITSGAYPGSAMPLEGVSVKLTDMSLKARRCLRLIREVMEADGDDA